MSNWGGADWGKRAPQYAQSNHKQGFTAKRKLSSFFFAWKGGHVQQRNYIFLELPNKGVPGKSLALHIECHAAFMLHGISDSGS
jgi:hypothetical protein